MRDYASDELLGVDADGGEFDAMDGVQVINTGNDALSADARVIVMGYDL